MLGVKVFTSGSTRWPMAPSRGSRPRFSLTRREAAFICVRRHLPPSRITPSAALSITDLSPNAKRLGVSGSSQNGFRSRVSILKWFMRI